MNDGTAKQQIVDKIKNNSNILVTVSSNPSVDELSAALGLTLLLNKMNKHATAVFSGAIPPAITFLDPQKTFENTVDSLRDFIIALDKEKADHLRYKVDGDVVKIFITPYRTTISSDDLDFSQGDYNVELVLGLGVKDRDDLDGALAAHGRILHDATVMTVSAGEAKSQLGSVDWSEESAGSLSEMLVGLSDGLKDGKNLLDEQIATAFLTGIVAATDRFSNNKTSSRVMTIAAQLMSAGANQQLIASKLEEAHEIGPDADKSDDGADKGENSDGTTDLSEGESTKVNKKPKKAKKPVEEPPKKKENDGELLISHEKEGDVDEVGQQTAEEESEAAAARAQEELAKQTQEVPAKQQAEAAKKAEENLAEQLSGVAPAATNPAGAATPSVADLRKDLAAANEEVNEAAQQAPEAAMSPLSGVAGGTAPNYEPEPAMGGTLNATTEQAAADKRKQLQDERNRTILTHNSGKNYVGDSEPIFQSPLNATVRPQEEQPMIDALAETSAPAPQPYAAPTPTPAPSAPAPATTLADIDQQNRAHDEARAAVQNAFGSVPFSPAGNPAASVGAQPLGGDIPHDQPAPPPVAAAAQPPMPPLPDFSTLPPLPPAPETAAPSGALPPDKLEDLLAAAPNAPAQPTAPPPPPNDPGQFKIPGQS